MCPPLQQVMFHVELMFLFPLVSEPFIDCAFSYTCMGRNYPLFHTEKFMKRGRRVSFMFSGFSECPGGCPAILYAPRHQFLPLPLPSHSSWATASCCHHHSVPCPLCSRPGFTGLFVVGCGLPFPSLLTPPCQYARSSYPEITSLTPAASCRSTSVNPRLPPRAQCPAPCRSSGSDSISTTSHPPPPIESPPLSGFLPASVCSQSYIVVRILDLF